MSNTRWKASWVDVLGRRREYRFEGPENRGIARIDFQLKILEQGEVLPRTFDLDEAGLHVDEETLLLPIRRPGFDPPGRSRR